MDPDDRFTNEKTIRKKRVYIYYYHTYPMQAKKDELLAIVDFVGISEEENGKKE